MDCDPRDIAIKSFFLGPQAENGEWLQRKWATIMENWVTWRRGLFPKDGPAISLTDQTSPTFMAALNKLNLEVDAILRELENETPKFTPRYIGHMVSEVSLPALLGHVCALLHNPNNTSREVSRVTSRLEDEAIADLAAMLGYGASARGHFTSGGTMANFEALWHAIVREDRRYGERGFLKVGPWQWAREFERSHGRPFPGFTVLVPGNKHYSWEKAVTLMGLGADAFCMVALDDHGRLNPEDLDLKIRQAHLEGKPVLMAVSVAGTTEMGEVDPVDRVQDVLDAHKANGQTIWHHVDAAFGGYFTSMLDGGEMEANLNPAVARALRSIRRADSVTLDPHKLGYVPYACGAFVVSNEANYLTRSPSAAYLQSHNKSRWTVTLEGSRSGAGVAATWLSNRVLGLNADGYGRLLNKGLEARDAVLNELARALPDALAIQPADLNIVCFSIAPHGDKLSHINQRTEKIWHHFESSPNFSVSKTVLRKGDYGLLIDRMAKERSIVLDADEWLQIRLVLMNPFLTSNESKTDFIKEFVNEVRDAL